MSNAPVSKPKSKRRKMRRFELSEISVVDTPAQKGAVMTIMKRGHLAINPGGTKMTSIAKIAKQMAALNTKLDVILKAEPYEVEVDEHGMPFEKEPEDEDENEVVTSEGGDEGGVPYQGKPRRGDWPPGSDTPGPGPASMTPERASEILQPYADHSNAPEEDDPQTEGDELYSRLEDEDEERLEELQDATHKFAQRLAKRFPRASVGSIEKTTEAALHSSHSAFDPAFGREREMMKRAAVRQPVRKGYSDDDLFERLEKRFGADAVERQFGGR